MSRRSILALGAGAMMFPWARPAASAGKGPVVVELFTSQGCSSCPPADRLAAEIRKLPGVAVMSLNVDYWDYLGWRDSLASPEFSQRQYDYAKSRGDMDVYTPQMVIGGRRHLVGSDRDAVLRAIEEERKGGPMVPVSLDCDETECTIAVAAGNPVAGAAVWLLAIAPAVDVTIERGENAGKAITYVNAVRKLVPAGMWHGEALKLAIPRASVMTAEAKGCVALLQAAKVGPVLGCALWGDVGV